MKRLLVLLLVLLIGASAVFCVSAVEVSKQDDRVTVTEQVLYGDASKTQGATVNLVADLDRHLHWDVTYPAGGEAVTDYDYTSFEKIEPYTQRYHGIYLNSGITQGYDLATPVGHQSGLQRVYRELFDATAPGETGTRTVRLQDLYDYYPIEVDINLPGVLWQSNISRAIDDDGAAQEKAVRDAFQEFFKIPVPDCLTPFEIQITKSKNGQSASFGQSATDAQSIYYSLYTAATYTSSRCFFALNNRIYNTDEYLDTSLIPGGYGIYAFDYRNVRGDKANSSMMVFTDGYDTGIDPESLAMVFPLPQSATVYEMQIDPTETKLLLVTETNSIVSLHIIDIATMTELQVFRIHDHGDGVELDHRDGMLLVTWNDKFRLFTVDASGQYTPVISASQPSATDNRFPYLHNMHDFDYNGEYLIFTDILSYHYDGPPSMLSFCLAVYSPEGLLYYGEYATTLPYNDTSPTALDVTW